MSYLKEEIKAGFIIITAFVILSLVIIVIGGKHFFKSYDYYYIKVKNVTGIDVGSQVKLAGVTVGSIVDIKPPQSSGDFVTIKIGLKKGTKLYKGTQATISQIGFIGDIFLLLSVDDTVNEPLAEGSIIPSEERMQFTTLMAKLDELSASINTLVTDVNKLFSPKNLSNVDEILTNTNAIMGATSTNVDKVATSLYTMTTQLTTVLADMEDLVKSSKVEINDILKKSSVDLEKTGHMIKAVEDAAKSIGQTSTSVDKTLNAQNHNIDVLLRSLTKTAEGLKDVMLELKHKPYSLIYKEGKGDEEK